MTNLDIWNFIETYLLSCLYCFYLQVQQAPSKIELNGVVLKFENLMIVTNKFHRAKHFYKLCVICNLNSFEFKRTLHQQKAWHTKIHFANRSFPSKKVFHTQEDILHARRRFARKLTFHTQTDVSHAKRRFTRKKTFHTQKDVSHAKRRSNTKIYFTLKNMFAHKSRFSRKLHFACKIRFKHNKIAKSVNTSERSEHLSITY